MDTTIYMLQIQIKTKENTKNIGKTKKNCGSDIQYVNQY